MFSADRKIWSPTWFSLALLSFLITPLPIVQISSPKHKVEKMGLFYTSIEDSDVDSSENLIANEKSQKTKYKPARKCSSQLVLALNGVFLLFNLILVGALYRGQPLEFRDVEKCKLSSQIEHPTISRN